MRDPAQHLDPAVAAAPWPRQQPYQHILITPNEGRRTTMWKNALKALDLDEMIYGADCKTVHSDR